MNPDDFFWYDYIIIVCFIVFFILIDFCCHIWLYKYKFYFRICVFCFPYGRSKQPVKIAHSSGIKDVTPFFNRIGNGRINLIIDVFIYISVPKSTANHCIINKKVRTEARTEKRSASVAPHNSHYTYSKNE